MVIASALIRLFLTISYVINATVKSIGSSAWTFDSAGRPIEDATQAPKVAHFLTWTTWLQSNVVRGSTLQLTIWIKFIIGLSSSAYHIGESFKYMAKYLWASVLYAILLLFIKYLFYMLLSCINASARLPQLPRTTNCWPEAYIHTYKYVLESIFYIWYYKLLNVMLFFLTLCMRVHLFANFHKMGRKCIRAYQTKDYGLYIYQ